MKKKLNIKNTIIYDFITQQLLHSELPIINITHTQEANNYNTCEYTIANSKEIKKLIQPCKVGIYTLDENNNIICGGIVRYLPVEEENNLYLKIQVFTSMKVLENAPIIYETIYAQSGNFKHLGNQFCRQIHHHWGQLAQAFNDALQRADDVKTSYHDAEELAQGKTTDLLGEIKKLFDNSNLAFIDNWKITSKSTIVPSLEIVKKDAEIFYSNALIDEEINVIDTSISYKGEYANAIMVTGAEQQNNTDHVSDKTLPPLHAFYRNVKGNELIKWKIISDERHTSKNSCMERAKKEYQKAIQAFNIDTIKIKQTGILNIYNLKPFMSVVAKIKNTSFKIKIDKIEYDYAGETASITTKETIKWE